MKSLKKYKSVFELINNFPNEEDCINYLESIYWPNKIISPFDINSDIYKLSEPHTYMCKNTQKKFNIKTNTVFSKTRLSYNNEVVFVILFNILEINKINGLIKSMCSNVNYNNPLLKDFVNKNKNNLIIKKFSSFRTREYKNAYSKKKKHIKDLRKLGYVILNKD